MPHQVFVSYSQPDRICAIELVARLEAHGFGVWVAPRDVVPASDWAASIITAIGNARLMVLVFSGHCNESPHVRREVECAVHRQLPILPFRIEDVPPSSSLEYFLGTQHWMDAFALPRESHYERLCAHVGALLGRVAAPAVNPPPPVAAPSERAPDERALQHLTRELARHVGPVAQHLVGRAAKSTGSWEQLCRRLAEEIGPEADRQRFIDACRLPPRPEGRE